MSDLRQAAQQALDLLDSGNPYHQQSAATALRKALEQPEQEPVISAWSLREVYFDEDGEPLMHRSPAQPEQEPVSMRMPKVGDKIICLEDESLGEVVSLTAGGSPDIAFNDGSRGTYTVSEFLELFGYVTAAQPPAEWELIKNILAEYGLDAIAFVAQWKAAQRPWQGLEIEEVQDSYNSDYQAQTRAVEAKLKERNGY